MFANRQVLVRNLGAFPCYDLHWPGAPSALAFKLRSISVNPVAMSEFIIF